MKKSVSGGYRPVVSTVKHPAYEGKILIVRRLNADRKETDEYEIAGLCRSWCGRYCH